MKNRQTLPSRKILSQSKRASVSASITVEAALTVPLFFLAVVSLLYLMEMMCIQTAVRSGLQYAGKEAMKEAYVVTAILPGRIESQVVQGIGADRLGRSIVVNGSGGIDCSGSRMSPATGIGELKAVYQVRLPIPVFGVPPIQYEEAMKIKGWTGYEKEAFGSDREETVYVTETGLVYHKDYHCTHLELSIHLVPADGVSDMRNEGGGRYYPCESCGGSHGNVYITDTGDRYHSSLSCSGLKRTIYAVPLSEVAGKGACSRCGQ